MFVIALPFRTSKTICNNAHYAIYNITIKAYLLLII